MVHTSAQRDVSSDPLSFYLFLSVGSTGVNVAEHDWHHEKFTTNYSLSFKYLDKIFGTYHPGRVPGEQKSTTSSVKAE